MAQRTNFRMEPEYITMVRGDTLSFSMEIIDLGGDLDSAYFTCKKDLDSDDVAFQKSIGDGITKVATDTYTVRIAPDDTYDLDVGRYWYDLVIGKNGDVFTVKHGVLELVYDVTREE